MSPKIKQTICCNNMATKNIEAVLPLKIKARYCVINHTSRD